VLAPGQRILMDYKSIPMLFVIKAIQLVDLSMDKASAGAEPSMSDPRNRGILTRQSQMSFFKDAKSRVNLKASKRRPAANAIFTPDFKFEDMGIGGLDKEFSAIFRRAFASRIFPPGLIESMGIQHVKGILLFGPPGTGKTLIARRIGKMLNAREPKVINGPEVLNKYVGQSEENIRKLFADAEKEYKEKGDESGLHIIIFDVSGVSLLQVVSEDDSAALLVRALCKNEQVSNPTGPPSARQAVPNEGIPRCRRGRGRMKLTVQSLRLSMIRLRTMSGGPKVLLYNMTWFMFWGTHSAKNATSSGIWPVDASFQVTTYFEVYLKKFADSGILQELDAVCKQRGSGAGGGTGVGDSVVNQLLSKLDGVDQLNNILLIGMTNRMDMIDDALLRPGRLEVHMEISLPDEYGRVQILKIHTSKMRESGNLDPDVSIEELAHLTKNFSGAEISGLVRSATSFALNRHVKVGTMAGVSDDVDKMTVNRDDFEHAFDDVKPSFGVSEDEMQRCLRGGIIHFSEAIDGILNEAKLIVKQVQEPDSTPLFSTILYGPPGSGKTALAAQIALASEYPLIKMCSPDNMIGMTESMKIEHMRRIFDDAYKSPLSVVVIDNIERIIEWVPVGPRFSNPVLQAMMVLLKKEPPRGRRLLVLATTGERSVLQQLDVFTSFDSDIAVPNVKDFLELSCIMKQSGAFSNPDRAIQELREMTQSESVGVGIKKVLLGIETAKQDRDREGRFAQTIARAKAQMGFS